MHLHMHRVTLSTVELPIRSHCCDNDYVPVRTVVQRRQRLQQLRRRLRRRGGERNASLLLQTEECNTGRHPLLANNLQDGGADSDTNSHCALILEETTPTSANHNCGTREKSNGNNNYEMREFNRRLLLSNGGSPGTQGVTAGGQSRRT
uniref:Uncharacterized protein n=1 Tax=Vespula pensylvanica TaxID=30213 RepID=A0A834NXK3_VESPE|nr:hypothetical protein H0235_010608 [Vespula pensylvanica]